MTTAVVFSKDRALQLDACLRSMRRHCQEAFKTVVLWKATTAAHQGSYYGVMEGKVGTLFDQEGAFECDVRQHLEEADETVLFVVDDSVFVRPFSPSEAYKHLQLNDLCIGASLRLGMNVSSCYPVGKSQELPTPFGDARTKFMSWDWKRGDGDWGYPLEVSSSIYRTKDIVAALDGKRFANPNELEIQLARAALGKLGKDRRYLSCYPLSRAFSIPLNRVQNQIKNRCGSKPSMSPDALLRIFEKGYRVQVEALDGYTPNACHQEIELPLVLREKAA